MLISLAICTCFNFQYRFFAGAVRDKPRFFGHAIDGNLARPDDSGMKGWIRQNTHYLMPLIIECIL